MLKLIVIALNLICMYKSIFVYPDQITLWDFASMVLTLILAVFIYNDYKQRNF